MLYGGGIRNAASSLDGGYTWSDLGPFLQPRSSLFDSELVEGGPMPLPLSDGKVSSIYITLIHLVQIQENLIGILYIIVDLLF